MIYVLAGSSIQAEQWAQAAGYERSEYRFIRDHTELYGALEGSYVLINNWYERKGALDLLTTLQMKKIKELDVDISDI